MICLIIARYVFIANIHGMNYRLSLCERTGKERDAYNVIYPGNSLNVCICLKTAWITDGSH